MNDKELLELAAKAAGVELWTHPADDRLYLDNPMRVWNPLTDDGDALRLAVKLNLLIAPIAYEPGINAYGAIGVSWQGQRYNFDYEHFTDDPYTATRRAVVRAAAEIGKSL